MISAANNLHAKSLIVCAVNDTEYNKNKITIIAGTDPQRNSLSYTDVFHYYMQSKFIVIPIEKHPNQKLNALRGLTSFVDAVVLNKPVLVSDNTNMGIDIEGLGIGVVYRAGDNNDMLHKMEYLMSLSVDEYKVLCNNMKNYSQTCNYEKFCEELLRQIEC